MLVLKMELYFEKTAIAERIIEYNDVESYFTAFVEACDQFGISIPIWGTREEILLERNGFIEIPCEDDKVLRVSKGAGQ